MPALSQFSRYHATDKVIDFEGNRRYIEWKAPRFGEIPERVYLVTQRDLDRPDIISWEAYGTVELWWVILFYNGVNDPYSIRVGDRLKIPDYTAVRRAIGGDAGERDLNLAALPEVAKLRPYRPPTFRRVGRAEAPVTPAEVDDPLFNFGFPVPEEVDGIAHFQIQVSDDAQFANILYSLMTQTGTDRWFYFDHLANNEAGGFSAFPVEGINADVYQGQSVYRLFKVNELTPGNTYYFRYRAWVDNLESAWFAPAPIII